MFPTRRRIQSTKSAHCFGFFRGGVVGTRNPYLSFLIVRGTITFVIKNLDDRYYAVYVHAKYLTLHTSLHIVFQRRRLTDGGLKTVCASTAHAEDFETNDEFSEQLPRYDLPWRLG